MKVIVTRFRQFSVREQIKNAKANVVVIWLTQLLVSFKSDFLFGAGSWRRES